MNYGQRFVTLYRGQGSRPPPRKRNAKKAKLLSEDALQIAVKRREAKSKVFSISVLYFCFVSIISLFVPIF